MQTSMIGASTPVTSQQQATSRGFSDLGSEDFFRLLITELQSQDPMKPTDNQQLMDQLSSIRQMEQSVTLNKTLQALAAEQRFGATSGLIGHYVTGTVTDNAGQSHELSGVVIGVRFDKQGQAILELHNGSSLPASKVEQVTLVENLPADVRAQLAQELGRTSSLSEGDGEGDDGEGGGQGSGAATSRAVQPDVGAQIAQSRQSNSVAGDHARGFARKADVTASYLDALLG